MRQIFSAMRSRARFVRKGLAPDPARETLSVLLDTK
jgi:hypothetical protein